VLTVLALARILGQQPGVMPLDRRGAVAEEGGGNLKDAALALARLALDEDNLLSPGAAQDPRVDAARLQADGCGGRAQDPQVGPIPDPRPPEFVVNLKLADVFRLAPLRGRPAALVRIPRKKKARPALALTANP